jgi:hypothetical protein
VWYAFVDFVIIKLAFLKKQLVLALVIFIIVEVKRKNGDASKSMIAAEFIYALILIANLIIIILGLIARFA